MAKASKPATKKTVSKSAPLKKAAAAKSASTKKAGTDTKTAPRRAVPQGPAAKKAAPPAKAVSPAKAAPPPKPAPAKAVGKKVAAPPKAVPPVKAGAKKAPVKPAKPAKPPKPAFDAKFLEEQRQSLFEERLNLIGSAERLEGEAAALMEDLDPGDVQFDDESGEGDSLVVERERDLALSGQARQMIADIDAALQRLDLGTYGLSTVSGRPIPKERLRAIPWATELVEEKVGGLGRR